VTCAACGSEIDGDFAYCPRCGTPVSRAAEPVAERKIVTVLFADLVGFTARAEQLDPEDVSGLLSPYHRRLRTQLERYGGTVEKFIGDAVVALFGAPVAHEDDPERAVRAALAIRDGIAALAVAEPEVGLQVRIAVNTGEALVVVSARPNEGEGMAAGDVINTAARLQAAAPPNGVLVGERTYYATRGAIEYRAHEPVQAKGKRDAVPAWEAVAVSSTAEGDPTRRDSPLVGRRRELQLLQDALERVRRENEPELVTLAGVPGIGKSRLVFELYAALDHAADQIPRLQGRSPSYGDGGPFAALGEMLAAHTGILRTDSTDVAEAKLDAAVDGLRLDAAERRWIVGQLRPLAGLAADADRSDHDRGEAFAAWRAFFEAVAEHDGLVLVFEDLHWADEDLLDFIDYLVERTLAVPLLVVATTRTELLERRPSWGGGKRNARTVSLAPLTDEDTRELIAARLSPLRKPPAELMARIGGNPLFAEEYARMLTGNHGADVPLPESVQAIIAARLDALAGDEKALVHDAAVLGPVFWVGALVHLGGRGPEEAKELLHALERKEFVRRERRSSVEGEVQYGFQHVLVRDVAYGQIARPQRAEKHRRAAEWIEALAADHAADQPEMLAHHYGSALEYARAAGQDTTEMTRRGRLAFMAAGDRASSLNAHAAAVRFYAAALALHPADDPERPDALFRYGRALVRSERAGADELAEAREGLLANGDRERAAAADVLLSALLLGAGERERAHTHLIRAATLLEGAAASPAKAYVLSQTARFLIGVGQEENAIGVAREALEMADRLGLDDLRAQALSNIGFARVACGDAGGIADLEGGLAIAVEVGSTESVRAYRVLGAAEHFLGNLERGFELYEQARLAATRYGDAFNTRWLEAARVVEEYWTGRWDEAVQLAEGFVSKSAGGSRHYLASLCHHVRGEIALARGELEQADEDARAALVIGRAAGDSWLLNPALAFAARVEVASNRVDAAAAHADELLADWNESGSVVGYWMADLAVVLLALGRAADVLAVAASARHSTRWLDAACAHAEGDPYRAAAVYRAMGSRPDEAASRLAASEQLFAAGDPQAAARELESARAFFAEVGANAAVVDCDRRLARSSSIASD
jgi:predicted ATPase/class 3 adenylate cyclase